MPAAWEDKDERQYEHIKESEQERGRSTDRAKEIAARTVNKQRREEGQLHIDGRSRMNKQQLEAAIRRAR